MAWDLGFKDGALILAALITHKENSLPRRGGNHLRLRRCREMLRPRLGVGS